MQLGCGFAMQCPSIAPGTQTWIGGRCWCKWGWVQIYPAMNQCCFFDWVSVQTCVPVFPPIRARFVTTLHGTVHRHPRNVRLGNSHATHGRVDEGAWEERAAIAANFVQRPIAPVAWGWANHGPTKRTTTRTRKTVRKTGREDD